MTHRAPHHGVAYERFTPDGPVALLPEGDHYGLVWTMPPAAAERTLALPDARFLAELAAHFGSRVDGFRGVRDRTTFPLALEFARPAATARCVLIGNAAQTLHPVAGQGFNLGVRDAWVLAQTIVEHGRDALGGRAMLADFAARRRTDRAAGIAFTHGLTNVFAPDFALCRGRAGWRSLCSMRCRRQARFTRDALRPALNARALFALARARARARVRMPRRGSRARHVGKARYNRPDARAPV